MSGPISGGGASWDMLWFAAVMAALAILFAAGLRLPVPPAGPRRWALRTAVLAGGVAAVLLANIALYRHDAHLDLTRERAFTPSPEARQVAAALQQEVDLVYFYQKDHPAGRATATILEILGRSSPQLRVRTIDPDRSPALASRMGVRLYNAAVLTSEGRRLEVVTTDDREIALAILRITRSRQPLICFEQGHGEYDIDNFEFHTHFEGAQGHSHDSHGMAVVQMQAHGLGRLRRALEKLGFATEKLVLALAHEVPERCAAFVEANPRTPLGPPEAEAIARYLGRGGRVLMLIEPDYPVGEALAGLLGRAGIALGEGVVVDPAEHYFTDEQMIAVARYAAHPALQGLALSFFPGARPVQPAPAAGVAAAPLFASSAAGYVIADRLQAAGRADRAGAPRPLAVASEGRWSAGAPPFRLAVVGDADFASNSFFPYMANADLALGLVAWLIGEERAPAMKPPVEVLPTVALSGRQMQGIFIVTVLVMPGLAALAGGVVWWRRRR